jgi:hypothetical protein
MPNFPEMLTAEDIAKIFQISYHGALDFIKYSGVGYIKIGNQYRVSANKLQKFLDFKGDKTIILG